MNDPLPDPTASAPASAPSSESPTSPPPAPSTSTPPPRNDLGLGYWLRRLLVCNPFFLVSAALLLYAVARLSSDSTIFAEETTNLLFNFSALQSYSLLLVFTAIRLARHSIWYDSALLGVLEHGLVLVPFLLLSQAIFIAPELGWLLVAVAALVIGAWWIIAGPKGSRHLMFVPIVSFLPLVASPANWLISLSPAGVLALVLSFVLFGIGTAAAYLRNHWEAGKRSVISPDG